MTGLYSPPIEVIYDRSLLSVYRRQCIIDFRSTIIEKYFVIEHCSPLIEDTAVYSACSPLIEEPVLPVFLLRL